MARMCKFGKPVGTIMQVAYVVDDLEKAAMHWVKNLNIGPWMIMEHFAAENMKYYDEPTSVDLSVAMAFTETMSFELIVQHDDCPSVYKDVIEKHGLGAFHHWAITTDNFDADVDRYLNDGAKLAFSGEVVPVGRKRFAYIDTGGNLPGMIELIELNDAVEDLFASIRVQSEGWNGVEPVRRLG
ncbi:VOC family protein [Hyphococcus formosus]|uniref:VOC family protein n=1 Tax=Hyphococcus formosus TaxID=3143534 RepID=UPI00398B4CAB